MLNFSKIKEHIKVFALDIFFGSYLAITVHRIFWCKVIWDSSPEPISVLLAAEYIAIGAVYAALGLATGASVAGKLLRKQKLTDSQNTVAVHTAWILGILSVITGWVLTKISPIDFFSKQGLEAAGNIFSDMLNPEFSIAETAVIAMIETVYIALMATITALPFAFALSFFSARNLMKHNKVTFAVYYAVRIIANFTRSIEPLIWAIIFSVWVGIGPFAGMLALMLHTISSLVKQYSEQIEDIDQGPVEALEAVGAHPLQVIWYAIVPQLLIPFLSFTIYRWDINVRMATIIGMVGGGGVGTLLMQYQGLAKWQEVGLIVMLIAAAVWIMDYISAKARESLL
ncbi:hypothetical protein MASR2M18_21250 [Ignavibacteria bacterium]|nr:phosphonate ABC transporter, permease protein PhnE [Bacteroidota bacterium]MCZ2131667.1 phosphonate ABC transporter, permease protein PhnE [Bacteroidota bacterium]